MTHEQIEYRKYVMQGMASYGGDVAQVLVWCHNHFGNLSNRQRNAINNMSAKDRNQVIHELTMG